jgi:dsRNA-specific ribonuclease
MSIERHFIPLTDLKHSLHAMPLLLNYFERGCQLIDINREHFSDHPIQPEFLQWAVTGAGVASSRRCFEVLETYGDTVLKLAATLLAYWLKQKDPRAGENDLEYYKKIFVTNFHTFRVGYYVLRMHRYMRTMRDPEPKEWTLPLQGSEMRTNKCPGKSVADSVESLLGAHLLCNDNLHSILQWISNIKLVPLPQQLINKFAGFKETTLIHLRKIDLENHCSHIQKEDSLSQLLTKYFDLEQVKSMECAMVYRPRIMELVEKKQRIA